MFGEAVTWRNVTGLGLSDISQQVKSSPTIWLCLFLRDPQKWLVPFGSPFEANKQIYPEKGRPVCGHWLLAWASVSQSALSSGADMSAWKGGGPERHKFGGRMVVLARIPNFLGQGSLLVVPGMT